jgi:hypothetical protein
MDVTEDERISLHHYSADGYRAINSALRSVRPEEAHTIAHVAQIDAAIARHPLQDALVVYRGIGAAHAIQLENDGLMVDTLIFNPAFTSTSRSIDQARQFLEPLGLLFRIALPRSGLGLDMVPFAEYPSEEETLCPRRMSLRITGYDMIADMVEAEVIYG